jgi:chloride channel 7
MEESEVTPTDDEEGLINETLSETEIQVESETEPQIEATTTNPLGQSESETANTETVPPDEAPRPGRLRKKPLASMLFNDMNYDEPPPSPTLHPQDSTSSLVSATSFSNGGDDSDEEEEEEEEGGDSFNEAHTGPVKSSVHMARVLSRGKSRSKSFSELDKIKDENAWQCNRPALPMEQRKKSIRGTQAYTSFNREFYFPRNGSDEFEKFFLVWVMVTLLAFLVVIAGLLIDFGVLCTSFAVYGFSQTFVIDNHHETTPGVVIGAFVIYAGTSAFFAFLAGCLVVYVAPLAEGSGIPDVKSYLNGVHLAGLFSIPTLIAKAVGCAFSIGSGLIAGREGPIIHVGAIIGSALSQGSSQYFKIRLPSALTRHFRSAEWKRDFAVMGSACGVAAAFMAPMGGVLFAIEEGATVWRQQLTFLCLYACIVTAFITAILKSLINDSSHPPVIPGVLFGSYREDSPDIIFTTTDFPFVLLIGIIGGLVGSSFSAIQRRLMRFRKKYVRVSKYRTLLEVVLISLAVSTCRYWIPYLWGSCVDDNAFHDAQGDHQPMENTPDATPFHCGDHEGNDLGFLFWVPQEHMLKYILHAHDESDITSPQLFYAFIFYFGFTALVFGIAVPSGLFIPSFVIGATYGRLVGQLAAWQTDKHHLVASYTFLGCASALGGMTRVTISVALIALEATQNFNTSLYCFIVVIIAKLIADSFNIGIYDLCIERKEIPFLVDELGYEGYQLAMEDVMSPCKPVVGEETPENQMVLRESSMGSLRSVESVENVLKVLKSTPYGHEFLVNNAITGAFEGTIERLILLRIMENRVFGEDAALLHPSSIDTAWPNLRNTISMEAEQKVSDKLDLADGTDQTCMDLRPYIDREPPIVLASSSMRKAHSHIRNGERNVLIAAPNSVRIIGVVKRHDIMPGFLEATLHAKNAFYSRERAMSADNIDDPGPHPNMMKLQKQMEDEGEGEAPWEDARMEEYDPQADLSNCEVTNKSVSSHGKKPKALSLLPFEPRFYELLAHYLEHGEERAKKRFAKKNNEPFSMRYEMVPKSKNFKEVHTMSGK